MPDFPDNLGAIAAGAGQAVLPGPTIEPGLNPRTRDYADAEFRWKQVVGLTQDPDLGYLLTEATHYRLEITPDVGWPNTESMFEAAIQGTSFGNGRLTIIDRISLDELVKHDDETVTYTVEENTMSRILAPGFERYLWRVRAISTNGDLGDPSTIQTFRGLVLVPDTAWSVETPEKTTRAGSITLRGKRSSSISRIEINGDDGSVVFTGESDWAAEIPLVGGRNVFTLRAFDAQGNGSSYRIVETEVFAQTPYAHNLWNVFDDFAYAFATKRLPGESNGSLRTRIQDVYKRRGGARYLGLINGISRDLGLVNNDQAMTVRPGQDTHGRYFAGVQLWMVDGEIRIFHPTMVTVQEYHKADGGSWQIDLSSKNLIGRPRVEQPFGAAVHPDAFRLTNGIIEFLDAKYTQDPVYVSYNHYVKVSLTGKTIDEVIAEMEAILVDGLPLLNVTKQFVTGTEPAEGLIRFPPVQVLPTAKYTDASGAESDGFPIGWSEVRLSAFMDQDFKSRHVSAYGSRFGTAYEAYALQLKRRMHVTWGYLISDENLWSYTTRPISGIGSLETVFDAPYGWWRSNADGSVYSTPVASALSYLDASGSRLEWVGVLLSWLRSGVGDGDDLYVTMEEQDLDVGQEAEETVIITQQAAAADDDSDLGLGVASVDSSSEVL